MRALAQRALCSALTQNERYVDTYIYRRRELDPLLNLYYLFRVYPLQTDFPS